MRTLAKRFPATRERQLANLKELRERKMRKLGQIRAHGQDLYLIQNQLKKEQKELEIIEQDIAQLSG